MKLRYVHCLSHFLYYGTKIIFKMLIKISKHVISLEFRQSLYMPLRNLFIVQANISHPTALWDPENNKELVNISTRAKWENSVNGFIYLFIFCWKQPHTPGSSHIFQMPLPLIVFSLKTNQNQVCSSQLRVP